MPQRAVAPMGVVIVVPTLSLIVVAVAGGVCEWETRLAMPTSSRRRSLERVRHELVRVSHRGLDRVEFVRALGEILAPVVPFDGVCWHTADPATRLITSHYTSLDGSGFRFICANEYLQEDVAKFASLAGRRPPAAVHSPTAWPATAGAPGTRRQPFLGKCTPPVAA